MKDTIVARATPHGNGGIGIIRVSGNKSSLIWKTILGKKLGEPRKAYYNAFQTLKGDIIDFGIALWFPKPGSFTGEDTVEFQGHGGLVVTNMLIQEILKIQGTRLAKPGEFSERAFLNNKIDLVQAEAISDLISSNSAIAARAAINSLQGSFSKHITSISKKLTNLRVYIESQLDFSEEEIEWMCTRKILQNIENIAQENNRLISRACRGKLLTEKLKIVVLGQPNVGKSSLLNQLTEEKISIVTNIPGTTRDAVHASVEIKGTNIRLTDTAGVRDTKSKVEQLGIQTTWKHAKNADIIVIMVEIQDIYTSFQNITKHISSDIPIILVCNKIDTCNFDPCIRKVNGNSFLLISAQHKYGVKALKQQLEMSCGLNNNLNEDYFIARSRHIESLKAVQRCLKNSRNFLQDLVLLAEELHIAQKYLGNITGNFTSQDLLNQIFSSFCIGK